MTDNHIRRKKYISPAEHFKKDYLESYKPELFDTFDVRFAHRVGVRDNQVRAYNTMLYESMAVVAGNQKAVYCAGAISKGMLANALVAKEGPFHVTRNDGTITEAYHVYDLDENVGSQLYTDKVLLQNRRLQFQKQSLLSQLMPDKKILIPSALQGSTTVVGKSNFDLGIKRRDKDYMQAWTAVIRDLTDTFFVAGDWFFSGATCGLEYPEAIAIAAGLRSTRPEADMRFIDMSGKDVSLFDMSCRYAEYLLWTKSVGNFYLKHEATALMRNFAISTLGAEGKLPKANPLFMHGLLLSQEDMRHLQREMEPLILDRVQAGMLEIDLSDLASVNPDFVEKCEQAKRGLYTSTFVSVPETFTVLTKQDIKLHLYTQPEFEAGDFELKEIAKKIPPENYLSVAQKAPFVRPLHQIDLRGSALAELDGKSLFSNVFLPLLSERERLLVQASLGALETITASTNDRPTFIATGDKSCTKAVNFIRKTKGGENAVHSSSAIKELVNIIQKNPEIAVAPGEARLGEAAQTLLRHAFITRNVTDLCFASGSWENSKDSVQDMVLATRMQLGLQAGMPSDPSDIRVFDEKGRYLTLADRIKAVWQPLKTLLAEGDDLKDQEEPMTALTQLWALHRLSSDHPLRQSVFDVLRKKEPSLYLPQDIAWDHVSPFLFAYDHRELQEFWKHQINPVFDSPALLDVRLRHLDKIDDFAALLRKQESALSLGKTGPIEPRTHYRRTAGSMPTIL